MLFRPLLLLLLLALSLVAPLRAENIEDSMTAAEFKAAGLNKLSAEELLRLNAWLQRGGNAPAASDEPAAPIASTVAEDGPPIAPKYRKKEPTVESKEVKEVTSRISGAFTGWYRGKIFKLENGQNWLVVDDHVYESKNQQNPTVRIKANFMGSWFLSIEGVNRWARVRRIK